jgi:hypothetical protein
METDPHIMNILVGITTTAICLWCAISFLVGYNNHTKVEPLKIPDRFDIGYISDPIDPIIDPFTTATSTRRAPQAPQIVYIESPKVKVVATKRAVPAKEAESQEVKALKQQCVLILVGLGESKSDALRKVNDIFGKNKGISDTATFLRKAYNEN